MFTYACSIFYTAVCTKSELAWHICWKIQFLLFFYQKSAFFAQIAFAFLKEIDCIQGDLGNVGHLKDNLVTEYLFYYFLQHTYMYEFGFWILYDILYLSHSSLVLKKVMSTDDDVQDMYVHIWYVVYYNIIHLRCIDIFILVLK